ncbi:Heat shock transcription factor [Coemansia spiralis]|nr:Heat shock transcription factor [Coemansia spiralis]
MDMNVPTRKRARASSPLDDSPVPAKAARRFYLSPSLPPRSLLRSTASTSSSPENGNVCSANNYCVPAVYDSSLSNERGGELLRGHTMDWMDRCNNRSDNDQPTSSDDTTPADDNSPYGNDDATPNNGGQPDGSRTTPEDDGTPSGSDNTTPEDVGPPGDSRIPPNDRGRSSTSSAAPQGSRPTRVPAFHCILHSDRKTNKWIHWVPDKQSFQFCKRGRLVEELNAYGLKAKRVQSMVKNLRDYGFKPIRDGRSRISDEKGIIWYEYEHPLFQKDQRGLLKRMYRRRPGESA